MNSITPIRWQITCCAWYCSPTSDRISPPVTQPLIVDALSARQAGQIARNHGWHPAGRGAWWCPTHAEQAGYREMARQ